MMAIMGAAAKVDTKDTKKPIQDMWKDAWCGWLNEKMLRLFALFSLRKIITYWRDQVKQERSWTMHQRRHGQSRGQRRLIQPTSARLAFGSELALVGAENAGTSQRKRVQCMKRTYPQGC